MTRKEAAEKLKSLWYFLTNNDYPQKDLDALKVAIKALEQEPKWIPVSERLPEITIHSECGLSWSDYVLVYGITTTGEFGIAITQYCQDADGDDEGDWCEGYIHIDSGKIDDVLAWMPLPEPYKAESEEKE